MCPTVLLNQPWALDIKAAWIKYAKVRFDSMHNKGSCHGRLVWSPICKSAGRPAQAQCPGTLKLYLLVFFFLSALTPAFSIDLQLSSLKIKIT